MWGNILYYVQMQIENGLMMPLLNLLAPSKIAACNILRYDMYVYLLNNNAFNQDPHIYNI